TSFPVVVNANTSLLRIYATTTQMKIEVIDRNGKMLDEFIIKK
ncbi:MAG TPA: purple acid phosphatase, partial [Bacteroides thetaiotaomicron]|nr:purple acid phosphatase [Bacteroides thetaiotaomicron]